MLALNLNTASAKFPSERKKGGETTQRCSQTRPQSATRAPQLKRRCACSINDSVLHSLGGAARNLRCKLSTSSSTGMLNRPHLWPRCVGAILTHTSLLPDARTPSRRLANSESLHTQRPSVSIESTVLKLEQVGTV